MVLGRLKGVTRVTDSAGELTVCLTVVPLKLTIFVISEDQRRVLEGQFGKTTGAENRVPQVISYGKTSDFIPSVTEMVLVKISFPSPALGVLCLFCLSTMISFSPADFFELNRNRCPNFDR